MGNASQTQQRDITLDVSMFGPFMATRVDIPAKMTPPLIRTFPCDFPLIENPMPLREVVLHVFRNALGPVPHRESHPCISGSKSCVTFPVNVATPNVNVCLKLKTLIHIKQANDLKK